MTENALDELWEERDALILNNRSLDEEEVSLRSEVGRLRAAWSKADDAYRIRRREIEKEHDAIDRRLRALNDILRFYDKRFQE